MPPGPHDVADGLAVMVGQVVHLEELGEAQHAVERGAQLVAHAGQEVALGLAGLLGRLHRHVHLGFDLELVGHVTRHDHRAHGRAVVTHHRLPARVEHDPAAVGVADPVGQVELRVGLEKILAACLVDPGEIIGMDERLDLFLDGVTEVVAEDAGRRFADLPDAPVAVEHGDDVGARPDDRVEQPLALGQCRPDPGPFGDVGGDGRHPADRTGPSRAAGTGSSS